VRVGGRDAPRGATLAVSGLSVSYGPRTVLEDVSFTIHPGEVVAVVGANGAGKSSLFNAISGCIPHSGAVIVEGRECHHRRERANLAVIPQRSGIDPRFPISVLELVSSGRRRFRPFGRRLSEADRAVVEHALGVVGLADHATRPIRTLSGGQLQRGLLARALAQEADVLLLDEALSGVDQPSAEELIGLFEELGDMGTSVLVATHDLSLVRRRFARCLPVNRKLLGDGTPATLLQGDLLDRVFGSGEPVGAIV
jgi:manganese/iron transport system ATP-binding protein